MVFLQKDVLHPQAAAPNGVSFILILLIAYTKCQLVDQVCRGPQLPVLNAARLQLLIVVLSDLVNGVFQAPRFFVLALIIHLLETTRGRKLHVLVVVLLYAGVQVANQPSHIVSVYDASPTVAWKPTLRDRSLLAHVHRQILRHLPRLQQACLRVFSSTLEKSWKLQSIIPDTLQASVH